MCNSYLEIISFFLKVPLCPRLLLWYNNLHCVNQIGQTTLATLSGILMAFGLGIIVVFNSLLIVGWNLLPLTVYLLMAALCVVMYFCLFQTLPIVVRCHDRCNRLIQCWKQNVYKKKRFSRLYSLKVIASQRNVAVYYAVTKFEMDTKRNYYSSILLYTINVILLW